MADVSNIFDDKAQAVYIGNMADDVAELKTSIKDIKNMIMGTLVTFLATLTAATVTIILFILNRS